MDDPMSDFSGWRSDGSSDDGMETDMGSQMEVEEEKTQGKYIPGLTSDQQKVFAVVENVDSEEGADIASDFAHLGSKFRF